MQASSIFAIYTLFWFIALFMILPIGIKTDEELGQPKIPGQADSAPGNLRPWRVIIRTTILAAIFYGLFHANYIYGWITTDSLNFFEDKPWLENAPGSADPR